MSFSNPYPGNQMVEKAIRKLSPDMERLKWMDNTRLEDIRRRLSNYVFKLPNQKRPIVQAVIYNINKIRTDERIKYRESHCLSDHAFVRVLERAYGFDVKEIKDKALQAIHDAQLKPQYSPDGKTIMTVL